MFRTLCFFWFVFAFLWTNPLAIGQGTVTFDSEPFFNGTNYNESGIWFRLVIPTTGQPYHDYMVIATGIGIANVPTNPSPYMFFIRQYNPYNYVSLSLTNGSTFGLTSVQLADPISPSYSLLPITFIGFRADGSTVSQTFTTPGGGANSFLTYKFSPDFGSGLLSVQIDASRWAMDNLVWVPEPSTYALLGLGLLILARRRFHPRRKL